MPLHLPPELERRVAALAAQTHREPESVLADIVGAALDDDEALRSEVRAGPEGLPHDWNDYLRYRFEEGRKAFARGEGVTIAVDELMDGIEAELGIAR
jgi:hypothetical protein